MALAAAPAEPEDGASQRAGRHCRLCRAPLTRTFVDLGPSPLAQSFLLPDDLDRMEPFYPLHVWVCNQCLLVQLGSYVSAEAIFSDYAYFSSYSDTWVARMKSYCDTMVERLGLSADSHVVEVASNDGYLLQHFAARGIPVLGIDPAANVAQEALKRGIPTRVAFFGRALAEELVGEGRRADLLIGNNVLAHVPDLHDFLAGMKRLLAPYGVITVEFPHVMRLMEKREFDTIYHEHFSYYSFLAARRAFAEHQLTVFDVQELPTHGGSLRLHVQHSDTGPRPVASSVGELLQREQEAGLGRLESYTGFADQVHLVKRGLLTLLIRLKDEGRAIVGYGASAKGNTLLNFCGIRTDFLDYTVDLNPHKQGTLLPGTRIPVHEPAMIETTRPDYVLVLPWNLEEEIVEQLAYIREWGGRFIIPVPEARIR